MGNGKWITILGIAATLLTAGLTGFVANESRITTIEQDVQNLNGSNQILIKEIMKLHKEVHQLKGQHMEHVKNTMPANE